MHYHLDRIIKMVELVGQDDFNIICGAARYPDENDLFHEPVNIIPLDPNGRIEDLESCTSYLEFLYSLFEAGSDIILETMGQDDGGPVYQAYIIRSDHKQHYQDYYDDNEERDGAMLWEGATMEYILKYPKNIVTVWSGPY